jgi:hypothetical protein
MPSCRGTSSSRGSSRRTIPTTASAASWWRSTTSTARAPSAWTTAACWSISPCRPFGSVYYLNAEADLRDVPLGTFYLFFLHQDEHGAFTMMANMEDEYTMVANHGFSYRLDEVNPASHKLLVTKHKVARQPRGARANCSCRRPGAHLEGRQAIALADLAPGRRAHRQRLRLAAPEPAPLHRHLDRGDTQAQVSERAAQAAHAPSSSCAGCRRGSTISTARSSPSPSSATSARACYRLFKDEGIVPSQWASEHRRIEAVVANQELRSYNPPVDKQGCKVVEARTVPADCYGSSGEQWVIEPDLLLEGFRTGRIVRLFVKPSWPIKDMPFGEGKRSAWIRAGCWSRTRSSR